MSMKQIYDLEFARARLVNTVILIAGEPCYIKDVYLSDEDGYMLYYDSSNGDTDVRIALDDPLVSHIGPKVGYYVGVGGGFASFYFKTGSRQWKMGSRMNYDTFLMLCRANKSCNVGQVLAPNWFKTKKGSILYKNIIVAKEVDNNIEWRAGMENLQAIYKLQVLGGL